MGQGRQGCRGAAGVIPTLPWAPNRRRCLQALIVSGVGALTGLQARAQGGAPMVVDETWHDATRRRDLPVRIRWPQLQAVAEPVPVVLFSHGLGGTRDGGTVWGEAWARAGFVVLHLQHPGSDLPTLRAAATSFTDRAGLRAAGNASQLLARLQDTAFVLDQIGRRHAARQERWSQVRPTAVGMSGHSFGAHTTLGMAGQRYVGHDGVQEPRLASFIAFSPSVPVLGDASQAFERLIRPVLSITGTRDQDVVGNGATPERRMAVFAALPPGGKGHLVLEDADHMTFGGQDGRVAEILPRDTAARTRQPRHHALLAAITTDWWRATMQDDAAARSRLRAPEGLGPGDLWQQK